MSFIKWSLIKRIANSGYARLTVLVPVIGWLLLANDEVAKIISNMTGVASILQPSWKIYALHAGLSIFGVGIGLFYLLCPSIIKNYSNFEKFATTDMETITSSQLDDYNNTLTKNNIAAPSQTTGGSLAFPLEGSEAGRDIWQSRNKDLILKTQYAYYNLQDDQGMPAKLFVLFFLVVGGSLTSVPSLFTIAQSFRRLLEITISNIF